MGAQSALLLDESIRRTVYIRELLNSKDRIFAYSRAVQDSYAKEFTAVKHDIRLMNFARDIVGAVSDCYILYAIAMMGVCDIECVQLFLTTLSDKHKDLSISDMKDRDGVKKRVDALVKHGFLFKHRFEYKTENLQGKKQTKKINLYSIEKSCQHLVTQRLGVQLAVNEWIDAKPLSELMGWAACAYVRGRIVERGNFLEYKQGVIRTKAIGTAMYPGEVKLSGKNGESITVGFIQAFMRHNKAIQTREQFEDSCLYTVNTIRQFFYVKDLKKKESCVVVVVEDNPDLMTAANFIYRTGILANDYDRIFFTGEGVMRNAKTEAVPECFLQLKDRGDGYDFVQAQVPFLPD